MAAFSQMRGIACTVVVLLTSASWANAAVVSSGSLGMEGPMTEAINMLEDMKKDLEKEQKEEEDAYKKLDCWCKKNDAEKKEAIEAAQQKIEQLQATAASSSGATGELSAALEQLNADVAEGEKAIAEATEIRKKEAAAFHNQEKDLIQSIELLHGAITALEKHHPAMLQSGEEQSAAIRKMLPSLRHVVHSHLNLLSFLGDSEQQKHALLEFLDATPDLLESDVSDMLLQQRSVRQHTFLPYRSYAPQSGQIFGVLKQMKEAFEEDLPAVQKEEMAKIAAFAEMKGSKEAEIKEMKASIAAKTAELATAKEQLAIANEELEDTRESMDADNFFLREMGVKCVEGDKEYARRSKLRAEEIAAVAEAIQILSTDEIADAQKTTFGFFQVSSASAIADERKQRARAAAMLQRASVHAPELTVLLQSVRADPFAKVLKALDDLAAKLKEEQAVEVKKRDFCLSELHENEADSQRTEAQIASLQAKIDDLTSHGKTLTSEISLLRDETTQLQVEQQRASQDRATENMEFQRIVADQRRARSALERAHAKLAKFYNGKTKFLQQAGPAAQWNVTGEAPKLKEYKEHASSNKILLLLQNLAGEARVLEEATVHGEQEAQAAYEALVAETNDSVKAKTRLIADKTEELANTDEARLQSETEHGESTATLAALADSKAAIHKECDFLLKNFDTRQAARAAEMDSLAEVKAILSGMNK